MQNTKKKLTKNGSIESQEEINQKVKANKKECIWKTAER